ncbi:MAG: methylenetetrahydrofolate reductase [Deltaproteobacteria bacterium]|nr:methylenetetrahydrofolate reductase [Deltaproteobacteria bacterium]
MNFKKLLDSSKFVLICELQPPKGVDTTELIDNAKSIKGRVDAIYVPELPGAVMTLGSLAACRIIGDMGFTSIFEVNCSNKNRLALQSELLSASALGIENVIVRSGEDPTLGDHHESKPVFDLDRFHLLTAIQKLQEGFDMAGGDLQGAPRFCTGAVVNISGKEPALDLEIQDMEKMIRLGADFFLTTAVFDMSRFEKFMKRAERFHIPIMAEVVILKSVSMAKYMNKFMDDVSIPEAIIDGLKNSPDRTRAGLDIAAEIIRDLKALCRGVHIRSFGWEKKIPLVLNAARV